MEDKQEKWFESRVTFMVVMLTTVVGVSYFIWSQISNLDKQQALTNQKLDQVIGWTVDHDKNTTTMKDELNGAFADIYQKLGEKFIPKLKY